MAVKQQVWRGTTFAGEATTFMSREMIDNNNVSQAAVQADITAIAYTVYGADGVTVLGTGTLAPVSAYVYNTLQPGGSGNYIWQADTVGWNFKAKLPGTLFVVPAVKVVFAFTLTANGDTMYTEFAVTVLGT